MESANIRELETGMIDDAAVLTTTNVPEYELTRAFSQQTFYYNNCSKSVKIGLVDGTIMELMPRNNPTLPAGFIVTKKYRYQHGSARVTPPAVPDKEWVRTEQGKWQELLHTRHVQRHVAINTMNEMVVTYWIPENVLTDKQVRFYMNLSLTITMDLNAEIAHPVSHDGIMHLQTQGTPILNPYGGFFLGIQIVARTPGLSKRYVNIFNEVYEVPITYDPIREPGIYIITSRGCDRYGKPSKIPVYKRYDLAELDKPRDGKNKSEIPFELFLTVDEAIMNGNADAIVERELIEAEHEYKLRKAELEQENLRRSAEKQELEHQMKMKEIEGKNFSEILKWVPLILQVSLTLLTIVMKQTK